jgi:hypothetical protein
MKLVIGMLSRKGGASVDEISEKTGGWKAWTIRAFISATVGKKLGFKVESSKEGKGPRRYRIAA